MPKVYNKLVRDNIPAICESNNQKAITRTLDNEEYFIELKNKLTEEVNEYLESGDLRELADILEVIEALAKADNSCFDELLKIKEQKALTNGAFDKKLFLIEVKYEGEIL